MVHPRLSNGGNSSSTPTNFLPLYMISVSNMHLKSFNWNLVLCQKSLVPTCLEMHIEEFIKKILSPSKVYIKNFDDFALKDATFSRKIAIHMIENWSSTITIMIITTISKIIFHASFEKSEIQTYCRCHAFSNFEAYYQMDFVLLVF